MIDRAMDAQYIYNANERRQRHHGDQTGSRVDRPNTD